MDKTVSFITGGAGFIGSHLAETLVKKGHKVIVYDNFSTGNIKNLTAIKDKIEIIKGDIDNLKNLSQYMKGIDYVYHLAALACVARSMQEPTNTQKINISGTNNVLEAARINGVKKVLLASSSAVYGNGTDIPYKETAKTDCRSPYAASKLIGEELAKCYFKAYGLNTVCIRYFNVFGPRQNEAGVNIPVTARFIKAVREQANFEIDWDGKQSRDFIFIEDAINATLLVMQKGKAGEVYNAASGRTYSLLKLAAAIENLFGKKIERVFKPKRAGDIKKSAADISKISALGFKAEFTLEQGLKRMVQK